LKLCYLEERRCYFLNIGNFCQILKPELPLITINTEKGLTLIFPSTERGLLGLFVPISEETRLF